MVLRKRVRKSKENMNLWKNIKKNPFISFDVQWIYDQGL